jgi:SAM-dependent methyltransferase
MTRLSRDYGQVMNGLQSCLRRYIVPLSYIGQLVPDGGRVLELGCGQGLLIQEFAARVDTVVGIDYDARKCQMARQALERFSNVKILESRIEPYLETIPSATIASIILADTLSSMADEAQNYILKESLRCLRPSGLLLLKIIDCKPYWKRAFSLFLSSVIYKGMRLSLSDGQSFHYRPRGDYTQLLSSLGMEVDERILHKQLHHPIPHVVLIATKPGSRKTLT